MSELRWPIKLYSRTDQVRAGFYGFFSSRYLWSLVIAYLLILMMVLIYLNQNSIFVSEMALVLPGSGSSSQFMLDDVGQVSAQTKSPYSGAGFNPRKNYQQIIRSREVIQRAAAKVGISELDFEKPRVDLTELTSILSITVTGFTPDAAAEKSWALYQSFQSELSDLRQDEIDGFAEAVAQALAQYKTHWFEKRMALVEFQQAALLITKEQMNHATRSLSDLREKRLYAAAELKQREQFVQQLSHDLGVSPMLAGRAFMLNTDTQFRGYLRELDDSASQLSRYKSHWGIGHPKLLAEQKRFDQARNSLYMRSVWLVGEQSASVLHTMDLTISPGRAQLFADLVGDFAQLQGDRARADELSLAQHRLEDQLKIYVRELAELERLSGEANIAEAVYSSAAARLDAAKSDVFASYPVVQMLTPPSTPEKRKSPKLSVAIIAALVGIILVSLGALILWQRQYLVSQLLKKS